MPGMGMLDPFTMRVLLTDWQAEWGWNVALAVVSAAYLWGWAAARRRQRGVPAWRAGVFLLGTLSAVVCFNSALDAYSHTLFWVHMIQHLILIMLVPALWVIGSPLTVGIGAFGGPDGRLARAVRSGPAEVLFFPLTGLTIYTAVIVGTHLTSFMNDMVQHMWLHHAEAVLYLVAGLIFLWPLLGDEPIRRRLPHPTRILVLFLGMAPDTVVGIVLMQATQPLFPAYAVGRPEWAPSLVRDLYLGGGVMWFYGDMLMMCFILGVSAVWLSHRTDNATAGAWLEGVRRSTLSSHAAIGGDSGAIDRSADLDDDDAALAAYNEMLRSLNERERAGGGGD